MPKRGWLIFVLLFAGCGAARASTPTPASPHLRLLTEGATAHSAFHGATRVVSLGTAGFAAASPAHAWFFGWDGTARGDVPLPPRAWLAGVTSDARAIFAEPAGTDDDTAASVVARLGDGSRVPMPALDAAALVGAQLAPTGTTAASARGSELAIVAATGGARRVIRALRSPSRASVAWSPGGERLAVVDGAGGLFTLYLVAPSGATSEDLLVGALGDNPGAAVTWRSDDEILVRRGGGAFEDSEIVSVSAAGRRRPRTLFTVPGSVSSIAADGDDIALVSVRTRRTLHRAAWTDGAPLLESPALAEGTYLRPLGSLADGGVAYVERDESASAWVFRVVTAGTSRELGRLIEREEVAATTDGAASVLVVRGRADGSAVVVDLSSGAETPLAPDVRAALPAVRALACTTERCVLRSALATTAGVVLDAFDRATGERIGTRCTVEGFFPEPTGLSIASDGTRVAFAGTTVAPADDASAALDAATVIDLPTCAALVRPVPACNVEYAALVRDGLLVSGEDRGTSRWGLWLVGAEGSVTTLAEGDDRINRPIVQAEGTVLFGQQHVEASIYLWTP